MRITALASVLMGLVVASSGAAHASGQELGWTENVSSRRTASADALVPIDPPRNTDFGVPQHEPRAALLAQEEVEPRSFPAAEPDRLADRSLDLRSIGSITIDIDPPAAPNGELTLPRDYASGMLANEPAIHYASRPYRFTPTFGGYTTPADICHYPLYFEQINLERYGHTHGPVQPAIDALHFFGTLTALPYMAGVELPRQPYSYHYAYQAGRHAPWHHHRYPMRVAPGLLQAGLVIGLIAVLP